jgi:hypothetical protein
MPTSVAPASRATGLCALLLLPACAAFGPGDLAPENSITVAKAMEDLGRGFKALKTELDRDGTLKTGLFPCKVTVNFNVSAAAKQGGELVLQASTQPTQTQATQITNTVSASGTFTQTNSSEATRGNVVVVELYSAPCFPKDTLATLHPDKVATVVNGAAAGRDKAPFMIGAQ